MEPLSNWDAMFGVMFNDILGTTLGVEGEGGYTATPLTAFGDVLPVSGGPQSSASVSPNALFTGKPLVDGLGHAFLMRNYRAGLGKWLTADPLGYPDGWNQMSYGLNSPEYGFDYKGASWTNIDFISYYYSSYRIYGDMFDTDCMGLTSGIFNVIVDSVLPKVEEQIDQRVRSRVRKGISGDFTYSTVNTYDFKSVCFSLGDGTVGTSSRVSYSWIDEQVDDITYRYYIWTAKVRIEYSDVFMDPLDIGLESPFGQAFSYFHEWLDVLLVGSGVVVIE